MNDAWIVELTNDISYIVVGLFMLWLLGWFVVSLLRGGRGARRVLEGVSFGATLVFIYSVLSSRPAPTVNPPRFRSGGDR